MKKSILILFVMLNTLAFSQSKKEIITQKWKLDKVEEFGQEYPLMENQKNNWLTFTEDGKFSGLIENKHIEGTWFVGKKVIISVNKKLTQIKINWTKVKAVEKEKLAIEYQNGDLITSTLLFVPAE